MNAGLIVGVVRDKSGNVVSGASVWMFDLFGNAGGRIIATGDKDIRYGSPITETDSRGYFELAFAWSAEYLGHAIGGSGRVRMLIAASQTVWQTDKTNIAYDARPLPITGFLLKDVLGHMGLTPPDLKSIPGLIEFSKDILDSVSKLKSHPVFKLNLLSSESWLIVSAANLVINK